MKDFKVINDELMKLYKNWLNALIEQEIFYKKDDSTNKIIRIKNNYSNPYFVGVPKNWIESQIRIMICGREGYGEIGKEGDSIIDITCDENFIAKIQKNNLGYVDGTRSNWNFDMDNHAFSKIFKTIRDGGDYSVIWNECDKICYTSGENRYLNTKENRDLHNVKINGKNVDILKSEINILRPTHIIFLGYWRESLKLGKYRDEAKNDIFIFPTDDDIKSKQIELDDELSIKVFYLNHPNYKGAEYREEVDKIVNYFNECKIKK